MAQEVYEACVGIEGRNAGDPLPLAVRGPLFMLGARAVQVIRAQRPDVVASEEDALDVVAYLTEGYVSMMLSFNREHFEAWRSKQAAALGSAGHSTEEVGDDGRGG